MESNIETADYCIRKYTRVAEAHEQMRDYFTGTAAEARERVAYWTEERQRFIGLAGITNVVPLPPVGETIA